jgi:fused signal recognition particle receptor
MAGFINQLRERLGKTRSQLADNVKSVFSGHINITEDLYEALEEVLIGSDVGVECTELILEDLKETVKRQGLKDPQALFDVLKREVLRLLRTPTPPPEDDERRIAHSLALRDPINDEKFVIGPYITLIAGVNGSGKTTTTGKLAAKRIAQGKKVLLGAADTFRAGAIEQLVVWSERTGAGIVKAQAGADPAAVGYDTTDAAIARDVDYCYIDTAGRLHTKVNLMEELKKIYRVIGKRLPGAPHQVLLVIDATTGQNGLQQARIFTEALPVDGIILTKLDGTAKGGMAIAIQKQLGIPIKMIGVGESLEDLQPFDPQAFVEALFGS